MLELVKLAVPDRHVSACGVSGYGCRYIVRSAAVRVQISQSASNQRVRTSLHADASHTMTSNTMPPAVVDRLVSVHGKLLQLVEAMTELQGQIEYGGADGMMSW